MVVLLGFVLYVPYKGWSDYQADILDSSSESKGCSYSVWFNDVRNRSPNSSSIDCVTDSNQSQWEYLVVALVTFFHHHRANKGNDQNKRGQYDEKSSLSNPVDSIA